MAHDMDVDCVDLNCEPQSVDVLTDFATGKAAFSASRPKNRTLEEALVAYGASRKVAQELSDSAHKFIPFQRKNARRGMISFVCKRCGQQHPRIQRCGLVATEAWQTSIARTGWLTALNTWRMKGWKVNFEKYRWDHELRTRGNQSTAALKPENRLLHDSPESNSTSSELVLLTSTGTAEYLASDTIPKDAMPVWTSRRAFDSQQSFLRSKTTRELKDMEQQTKETLEDRRLRKEQNRMKKHTRAMARLARKQDNERRYMQLHNSLHAHQMTLDEVGNKFKRRGHVLENEIKQLEQNHQDVMIKGFADIHFDEDNVV